MRQASDEALADATLPFLYAKGHAGDAALRAKLMAAMPGLKERAKTLVELADGAHFLVARRPLALDDKAVKLLTPDARALLGRLLPLFEQAPWEASALDSAVRNFAEHNGLKLGTIAQPLRAALTGRSTSPGIFDVLIVLGKAESLARIGDQAAA
jgi:glutamyl-tRNA synthetase